jgi:hypothetical protein
MFFLQSVHVDGKCEVFGGLEEVDLAFEEEGVGAEINVFFAGHEAFDNLVDLRVDERFTARNGDHGGATFVGRVPTLLGGQAFVENVVGILDFATACAGKIATEEGLEHEHQRVVLVALEFLANDV